MTVTGGDLFVMVCGCVRVALRSCAGYILFHVNKVHQCAAQ